MDSLQESPAKGQAAPSKRKGKAKAKPEAKKASAPEGEDPKSTPLPKRRKFLQAEERDGACEILCHDCRRAPAQKRQQSLFASFGVKRLESNDAGGVAAPSSWGAVAETSDSSRTAPAETNRESVPGLLICNRCRKPMQEQAPSTSAKPATCPFGERLKRYKATAKETGVAFQLRDAEAIAIMREPCTICGKPAPENGNGITRLRKCVDEDLEEKGMGPYCKENTAPACGTCNKAKANFLREEYVEFCRHIATHQGFGVFGRFPERFKDNISKRTRSAYTKESKTLALTNEQFTQIVNQPCYYCGKEYDPPRHYNGLDRLDSTVRVYTVESCVACCGTCNTKKYRMTVKEFLDQCRAVAEHWTKAETSVVAG